MESYFQVWVFLVVHAATPASNSLLLTLIEFIVESAFRVLWLKERTCSVEQGISLRMRWLDLMHVELVGAAETDSTFRCNSFHIRLHLLLLIKI